MLMRTKTLEAFAVLAMMIMTTSAARHNTATDEKATLDIKNCCNKQIRFRQLPGSGCNCAESGQNATAKSAVAVAAEPSSQGPKEPELFDGNDFNVEALAAFGLSDDMSTKDGDFMSAAQAVRGNRVRTVFFSPIV
eukprot:jgi/Bigna1/91050/estExt_fgenesh1_pg.C_870001